MVYSNILEAVGNTPVIQLNRMTGPDDARVLVKFEGMNIGGSIKTRVALNMVNEAEARGELHEGSIIVEPTSGNQGIGLALVGAVKGYRVVIIMPDSVSHERRLLMHQYGAEVKLVHDAGNIGDCINECIALARKMAEEDPNVYMPDQFSNMDNTRVHLKGSVQSCGNTIPISGSTPVNRKMQRFYPGAESEPTCRWGSATDSFLRSWTRRSTTASGSSLMRRLCKQLSIWPGRKGSSAESPAEQMSASR